MIWVWLVVIIVGVVLDIASSAFLFVGFSVAALGGLIANSLGASVFVQFLIFGIISILFFILIYPKIKGKIKNEGIGAETMEQTYIGRCFILQKELNDSALIKYEGIFWTFKSNSGVINQGEKVRIIGIEGNKLIVEREN